MVMPLVVRFTEELLAVLLLTRISAGERLLVSELLIALSDDSR